MIKALVTAILPGITNTAVPLFARSDHGLPR